MRSRRWARFDTRGDDPREAFEAFVCQLFERWCRREHGPGFQGVRFVDGSGGDGGLDAYAELPSGDIIGLQAKWFPSDFGREQIKQIDKSFRTAVAVRPRCLARYFVALPLNLNDRTSKPAGSGGDTPRRRRPTKSRRERWDEWVARARMDNPRVDIQLWDDGRIEQLLNEPENETLHACWFPDSVLTLGDLRARFESAKGRWLRPRYFPDLHATAQLEEDLAVRLGEPAARGRLFRELEAATSLLHEARDAVARLVWLSVFTTGEIGGPPLIEASIGALDRLIAAGDALASALRRGDAIAAELPATERDLDALERLDQALRELHDRRGSMFCPTGEIRERLLRCIEGPSSSVRVLRDLWRRWQKAPRLIVYSGPPGAGKTHGLAHAVDVRLRAGLPAALLRAKELPADQGWEEIFKSALDRPGARLEVLLDALEATAVRADVRRRRECAHARCDGGEAPIEPEPTCFMLAVDGLEEPGQHRRWRELLGELPVHLKRHPRLRVAVTLRTASREAILGRLDGDQLDWIEEVPLAERGDAQRLLPIYCEHHGVEAPGPRLRWAIREPLSVRLYCELRKEDPAWEPSRRTLALPNLLRKKLDLAEEVVREQLGLTSEKDTPLHRMLTAVTSAYVQGGPLRRDEAIARARAAMEPPELLSAKAWVSVLEHAENYGLLLLQTDEPETLSAPRTTYVEPAHEPLMDYLIAEQTSREVQAALARGEAPALRSPLTERPDALTQTAILLGQRGISLVGSGLWKNELPASELERLELRAIAALEGEAARAYHPWVLGRLTASMSSCRRVLAELCVPVARDEAHPFGPRFVHEALSLFAPIQRDLFWPGPSLLDEGGQPLLCGHRIDVALEELSIEPDDAADGPPLLLAWALTSLDRRWRRRLRVALARWGAGRLDELLRWLDLTIGTNDPQMVEDIAMVAFGAACLAGANPRLGALATWVDVHLLTPGSAHRREDIVVLHAARGIVERAVAVGVRVEESSLEHARLPYAAGEALLAIDAEAARKADDHEGIWPIEGALARHVVPRAIEAFFQAPESTGARGRCLDPRVEHLLASHTSSAAVEALTPQRFAFGVIVAHLRDMGWDGAVGRNADELWARSPLAYADEADGPIWRTIALVRRAERAHDSARKPIDTVEEKYVWTGCRMLQAYLAARVPSSTHVGQRLWMEPPVDPIMASMLEANPASDVIETAASAGLHWIGWADRHLVPTVLLRAHGQLDRANEWVQRAPEPDIGPWLQLPGHAVPPWAADASWLTLRRTAFTREPQSQAHSELHLWSGTVPSSAADLIEREEALRQPLRPSSADTLFGFAESVPALSYVDPSEATWAPWAAGVHEPLEIPSRSASGQGASIAVTPTTAMIGWESQRGESAIWMLAHWLRRSLKLTGVKRVRAPMSEEWRFHDLHGTVHAVYTWRGGAGPELHEALLMQRGSLARLLEERGEVLVWGVRVLREPAGVLLPRHPDQEATCRWERRQFCWLSLLRGDKLHIFRFGESGEIAGVAPEPPALGSPASQESPGRLVTAPLPNPDHAVPLSSELDDENAIPYFLWDDPMPVHEVRRRLATASPPERDRLLGKILREARDPDVWRFTSPEEVAERFSSLSRQLGRRRAFWEFLLNRWHKEGLLEHQPA